VSLIFDTTMKLIALLSAAALLGLPVFALAAFLDLAALPVFAAVASALVALIGISDYGRRQPRFAARALRRRAESIPLAA
jgi:hypothetical protein